MGGFKGALSFFSSVAFFARDAFQNNVHFGIGILESFKYCSLPSSRDLEM